MSCKCGCFDKIKIVTDNPDQFQKAHEGDAGFDIIASLPVIAPAGDRVLVSTALKVAIPKGYVGFLKSRSGLALKHGLEVGAGVIDHGYTGEIKVLIHNHSQTAHYINLGDKIAQMVILPIWGKNAIELVESLDDSERGKGGFNSTGYKK